MAPNVGQPSPEFLGARCEEAPQKVTRLFLLRFKVLGCTCCRDPGRDCVFNTAMPEQLERLKQRRKGNCGVVTTVGVKKSNDKQPLYEREMPTITRKHDCTTFVITYMWPNSCSTYVWSCVLCDRISLFNCFFFLQVTVKARQTHHAGGLVKVDQRNYIFYLYYYEAIHSLIVSFSAGHWRHVSDWEDKRLRSY